MEGGVECPRCHYAVADERALVCPSCGQTLRLPRSAKLGLTVMGLGVLFLLVWAITIKSIFDFMAWFAGLFWNPVANAFFRAGPAPDLRGWPAPLGDWIGGLVDWLGLNPSLPPNDTLLAIGGAVLFLGLGIAVYGAKLVQRAQARAAAF